MLGRLVLLVLMALACSVASGACAIDTIPEGARRTPPGDGPRIVFDLTRRPLPEIPLPNDVATFPDPTSRTGRRINVSTVSPTRLESNARSDFDTVEGWGTFAPITVAFERDPRTEETEPAIDLADVQARLRDWDPADDPFYVVDLTTGIPVPLDVGKGSFPLSLVDRSKYWPNDPRATEDTVLFETVEEGAGLGQSAYRPELDTDFDGVLDHPNVIHRTGSNARIEDVIDWYERQTDTLILRPVLPLEEMREYAVVLTDRLRSASGAPVRSPFAFIHHAAQRDGAERVRAILSDAKKRAWYGDVAGTGLERVAFVWTFTTQPVFDDMRVLRDGLHGRGPLARLASEFPPKARAFRAVGTSGDASDEDPGAVDADPRCAPVKGRPYIVRPDHLKDLINEILPRAEGLGVSTAEIRRLVESLDDVSHFVVGDFASPYFLGDPEHEDPNTRFDVDFTKGDARVWRDTVQFWLSVPKARGDSRPPFPVTVWSHGTTVHTSEVVVRSGYFARQGIAVMGINMPGHGLFIPAGLRSLASSLLQTKCLGPWVKAITTGRHRDLNGDGVPDSGGLLWTAHVMHSRDNIRQSVVDAMQVTRLLRSWDGVARSDQDYDGDGVPNLAGDFDGDGVPDVGGPHVPITTSGNSFGGVVAMIHGAVDPEIVASAPISGGGGLMDVATRSSLVPDFVLLEMMSPLVVAIPAAVATATRCGGDQRSVRFVVNDLTVAREVEIACLSPAELDVGKTVVVANLRNGERRCARTAVDGRFRIPVPADIGDRLDVQIYDAPDAVVSYDGCEVVAGAPVGRRIQTFEQAILTQLPTTDESSSCEGAAAAAGTDPGLGCQQFQGRFYPVGSPLVAVQEGLGLLRQSPATRRLFTLAQAGVDPADPINFAPYYMLRPTPGIDGTPLPPRAIVAFTTAGDPLVPSATGYAFARAAGAVPFLPPSFAETHPEWAAYATPRELYDALGGRTPNDVLVESQSLEAVARLGRTRAGARCTPNYVSSAECNKPPSPDRCEIALFDPDWLSEGKNLWDAPHPAVPLRLARAAEVQVVDRASLERAWEPRLRGVPFAPDDAGYAGTAPLVGTVNAWLEPNGKHVFLMPNPCSVFDETLYYDHLLIRFLATQGRELVFLKNPASHHCLVREDCPFLVR